MSIIIKVISESVSYKALYSAVLEPYSTKYIASKSASIYASKMASNQIETEDKSFHPTKEMEVETNLIRYKKRKTEYLTIPSSVTTQTQWMYNRNGAGKTKVKLHVDFVNKTMSVNEA